MKTVMCAATIALGLSAASARVDLAPSMENGEALAYELATTLTVEQGEGEAAWMMTLSQTAGMTVEIGATAGDGSTSVMVSVDSIGIALDRDGQEASFEQPMITMQVMPDDEAHNALASVYGAILEAPIRLIVRDGDVVSVEGMQGVMQALSEQEVWDESVLGVFHPRQFGRSVAPIFGSDFAGVFDRPEGGGWQTEERIALGPAGAIEILTDWSLTRVENGAAIAMGKGSMSVLRPEDAEPTTPRVAIGDQTLETSLRWDVESGRLAARSARQRIITSWSIGDVTAAQTQEAESTLRFIEKR